MKVPKTFVPEKDLINKINYFLEEKQSPLYDHVKKVYEGIESKNICLLYGPPGTGKTFTSEKTREQLSEKYDISYINLQPTDSFFTETKEEYFHDINTKIKKELLFNKKVYVYISHVEKFKKHIQEALDNILINYKNNKNIVFILESYYKYLTFYFKEGPTTEIEFKKEL